VSSKSPFCRQEILPEIGPSGQAALSEAELRLPEGGSAFVCRIAESYATRAGVSKQRRTREVKSDSELAPWMGSLRHASAREIGAGATLALASMRSALGLVSELSQEKGNPP
jgi:hypothetical protein